MDRWYEAEDGNIWISFASADRNKLDEETYLILKNEHGYNTPVVERGRYRIIAIENEAPDDIKRFYKNMGECEIATQSDDFSLEYILTGSSSYDDLLSVAPVELQNTRMIKISAASWDGFLDGYEMMGAEGDLEVRVAATSGPAENPGTRVAQLNGWRLVTYAHKKECTESQITANTCEEDGVATLRWDEPFGTGADMQEALATAIGATTLPTCLLYTSPSPRDS